MKDANYYIEHHNTKSHYISITQNEFYKLPEVEAALFKLKNYPIGSVVNEKAAKRIVQLADINGVGKHFVNYLEDYGYAN